MSKEKEYAAVGKSVERPDARAKVTGEAVFTVDVQLPHMLYAKFLRSPHAYAKVISVKAEKALALEGVYGIVWQKDLIGMPLLADVQDDRVRYQGEAVAGVAAETEEIAERAVRLLEAEYEVYQGALDMDEAAREGAEKIWPQGNYCLFPDGAGRMSPDMAWEKGDAEKGMEESDVTAELWAETHSQYHVCLEPHTCVMHWREGMRELDCWISTQTMYDDRNVLAQIMGTSQDKVHIVCPFVGGGFGGKVHNVCKEYEFVALLTKKTRRPVRYVPSRAEETLCAMRHPARFYYKIGAKKDGTIHSVYLRAQRDGGAYTSSQWGFLLGSTDFVAPCYVKSPNCRYEGRSLFTNTPPCSAFRGFGYFESGTVFCQVMDMLAEKLHMDPVEFWLKNVPERGDLIGMAQGPITTGGIKHTIRACAEKFHWKEKHHPAGGRVLEDGRLHGIGMGYAMGRAYLPNFTTAGNALLQISADGRCRLLAGVTDLGQGQAAGLVQIAAEGLGVRPEDIAVTWGDTIAPHASYQSASATTMLTGNAVRLAAEDAKRQVLNLASPMLGARPAFMDIKDGMVYLKNNPKKQVPLRAVIDQPGIKSVVGRGNFSIHEQEGTPRSLVICMAEVAVDTETGKIEVLKILQGTDCGKIVSRSRVEGQMDAVLSGGLGYVLTEKMTRDPFLEGRILNPNLSDYKVPTAIDVDHVMEPSVICEDDDPAGPYGARGMGEATLSASAPAVINAVYNAAGIRFSTTSLTPEEVLRALGKL